LPVIESGRLVNKNIMGNCGKFKLGAKSERRLRCRIKAQEVNANLPVMGRAYLQ